MNRKQKIVVNMWRNYSHNCNMQKTNPLHKYKVFRNVYMTEDFGTLLEMKQWYKDIRIHENKSDERRGKHGAL